MLARCSIAVALVGCGRIGFDDHARASNDGGGGDDGGFTGLGNDAPLPVTCTPIGAELCNGIDDNCNGVIDEGCACTPIAIGFGESPGLYSNQLMWTGAGYLQVGANSAQVGVMPIDPSGTPGTFVSLYDGMAGDMSGDTSAAWTGTTLGVGFDHNSGVVELGRVDMATMTSGTTRLDASYPGAVPQVVWATDHFVVGWTTAAGDLVTRDVALDGTIMNAEQLVATGLPGPLEALALAADGTLIGCVRTDSDSTANVLTIDSAGISKLTPLPLGAGSFCQMLAIPGGFLIWSFESTAAPVPLAFVAPDGSVAGVVTLPDISPNAYRDIAIQRTATGFWVLAMHTTATLYTYAIDELALDDAGHVVSGPSQLQGFQGYLFSPPRSVATGAEQTWMWSADLDTWQFQQACP
jgi:hypothetical protein